jgi:hypothetical protein
MRMRRPMVHSPSAAVNACEAVAPEDRKSEDAHQPVQKKHRASSRQSAKIAMASFFRPGSFPLTSTYHGCPRNSPNYTLRQHPFALGGSFRYMVHNYIPYGVRPR